MQLGALFVSIEGYGETDCSVRYVWVMVLVSALTFCCKILYVNAVEFTEAK